MTTKIRTRANATRTEILALVAHPMTGNYGSRAVASPRYIERMIFEFDGQEVAEVFMSPNIAANPLTIVAVDAIKEGVPASVSWIDSAGVSGKASCRN